MRTENIPFVLLAAVILASCVPTPISKPTEELISVPTPVFTQVLPTQTVQPPSNAGHPPTATAVMERWVEVQNALAAVFLPSTPGLCEWEVLGQSGREVYVWAICQEAGSSNGAAMSAPAVIHLAEGNGKIEKVEVPRDGSLYSVDIRAMFPQDLHEKLLLNSIDSLQEMWNHIQTRRNDPEPPLVVKSGISLP